MTPQKHVIIIPSYNSGEALLRTSQSLLEHGIPILVVIDGSTDGSAKALKSAAFVGIRIIEMKKNSGKGGAVLAGMLAAEMEGFTHALVIDADGQHDANSVPTFVQASSIAPDALVCGVPIFGADAPPERVKGRKVGNTFAEIETLWLGLRDSLFGLRVYPIMPSIKIMTSIRTARRFDFDTELAVRLVWAGVRPISIHSRVTYPPAADGGVTHFRYLRDNLLLITTHIRLLFGMILRLPRLIRFRRLWQQP